jgi:DNA polymerase I
MPSAARERLFLLDSMNFVFRAFHQPQTQGFQTHDGLPTGCVLVFHNMLRKLIEEQQPDYFAAVFDHAAPTFRDDLFADYKANREAMPDELARQLPYIRKLLEAMRVPILELPGFEADDIIGTLAIGAARQGADVYIVSGDKDMRQLVRPSIFIYDPMKNLLYDEAKVLEVSGVRPDQIVDMMALQGDAVDNIPGAPGIGAKGAKDLISKFGTLDMLLTSAAHVERKTYRESLQNHREQILQSRVLVTVRTDVPVPLDLDALRIQDPNRAALREIYRVMEFYSLLKDNLPELESSERDYSELSAGSDFSSQEAPVAVAVSTYEAEAFLALSERPSQARTLPVPRLPEIRAWLEDAARPKSVHDAKATLLALRRHGIELRGVTHDTMLYSFLLDPTETGYELDKLAERHFEARLSGSLAERADVLGQMAGKLAAKAEQAGVMPLYRDVELPLAEVLADMESRGVLLDSAMLHKLSEETGAQVDALALEIYRLAGVEFNINSPQQLSHVLFEKLNLPSPRKGPKGKVQSTAADVLEELAQTFDLPRKVLEYRQLTKLRGTYMDALPVMADRAGRLHTSFEQTGAATGRLSSRDPNLQNVPVRTDLGLRIRSAFIAPPGWKILSADYSQIELRLLAHFSEDPALVDAFRRGEDIHARTAEAIFGVGPLLQTGEHRRAAKAINFGIVYGLSAFGLAQQLGIPKNEAQRFINEYFARYAGVRSYLDAILEAARRDNFVTTILGRRRPIPGLASKNATNRGFAERTATNTPLQGSAADLIKVAMINIHRELRVRKLEARLLLQVHDELVLEAPDEEVEQVKRLTKEYMEGAMQLKVPLVASVGVGLNWRDAK